MAFLVKKPETYCAAPAGAAESTVGAVARVKSSGVLFRTSVGVAMLEVRKVNFCAPLVGSAAER
ncbi:hypothetical protein FACS189497_12220 [Betaproteobacteria bacterium]|nr:hypothetical protein FACS189497_12220 [Betaproteobacteria bacterium]